MATMMQDEQATARRDALAERLFEAAMGTADVLSIYLGDQLGLYKALLDGGSMTPGELARKTGTAQRYVREWLEHQAATGILDADESGARMVEDAIALDPRLTERQKSALLDIYRSFVGEDDATDGELAETVTQAHQPNQAHQE